MPVALLSIVELRRTKLIDTPTTVPIDFPGAALLVAGMALTVLGIQQSTVWGWGSAATIVAIVAGVILLGAFWRTEQRSEHPLIDVDKLVANRVFALDNAIMFLFFTVWLAIFLFGSMCFQISAGQRPSQAGFSILTVFYTFFAGSRVGGIMMDKGGPKRPIVLGLLTTAIGLALWAHEAPALQHINVLWGQLVTGLGLGLVMTVISTDALNRMPLSARGEASGITQTVGNFGSAVGVALLGTIILSIQQGRTADHLEQAGVPSGRAESIANSLLSGTHGGEGGGAGSGGGIVGQTIGRTLAGDFADAFQIAFYVGAGILAVAFLIAFRLLPAGRQQDIE